MARSGQVAATVMAPISVESMTMAGVLDRVMSPVIGESYLFLLSGPLRVVHLTDHIPLRQVCEALSADLVSQALTTIDGLLKGWGIAAPRIGVASAAHYGANNYRLDWPSAQYGALPIEGGVAVAYRRQIAEAADPQALRRELEEKLAKTRSPYPSAESFAVHELIDPRDTRPALCDWIEWIQPQLDTLCTPVTFGMRP